MSMTRFREGLAPRRLCQSWDSLLRVRRAPFWHLCLRPPMREREDPCRDELRSWARVGARNASCENLEKQAAESNIVTFERHAT